MGRILLVIIFVGLAWLASSSFFIVDQTEKALLIEFGKIKAKDYTPGFYFKAFWQNAVKLDSRVQNLDSPPQSYLTKEKKNLIVDSFVKWKIDDVEKFYNSTGQGNTIRANDRLSQFILKHLKDAIGKREVQQVVSGERNEIMDNLAIVLQEESDALGVKIVDARIKRVDLPPSVSNSVYGRMASERKQVAKDFRSKGEERARKLRAEVEKDSEVIIANANRDSQRVRGDGDAKATEVYADAFGQDEEFYSFFRSMNAYQNTFSNPSDLLLLQPNTDFFKYFKGTTQQARKEPASVE